MDNTRFDPMRFSPRDLPSLEQLLREQSYQNRADVDLMSDYPRPAIRKAIRAPICKRRITDSMRANPRRRSTAIRRTIPITGRSI